MWKLVLYDLFSYGILIYSVTLLTSYIFIGLYSIGETRKHLRKSSFTDYNLLASSNFAPSVSILAPAYNEGANIIENLLPIRPGSEPPAPMAGLLFVILHSNHLVWKSL